VNTYIGDSRKHAETGGKKLSFSFSQMAISVIDNLLSRDYNASPCPILTSHGFVDVCSVSYNGPFKATSDWTWGISEINT